MGSTLRIAQIPESPNHDNQRVAQIIAVGMHHTNCSELQAEHRFDNPAEKASAHYILGYDHLARNIVRLGHVAYANGVLNRDTPPGIGWIDACYRTGFNPNRITVSIEHEMVGAAEQMSAGMMADSVTLCRYIRDEVARRGLGRILLTPEFVVPHSAISATACWGQAPATEAAWWAEMARQEAGVAGAALGTGEDMALTYTYERTPGPVNGKYAYTHTVDTRPPKKTTVWVENDGPGAATVALRINGSDGHNIKGQAALTLQRGEHVAVPLGPWADEKICIGIVSESMYLSVTGWEE